MAQRNVKENCKMGLLPFNVIGCCFRRTTGSPTKMILMNFLLS